jgi:hypothetical protein
MLNRTPLLFVAAAMLAAASGSIKAAAEVANMTSPPKAGPVEFYPEDQLKPGMNAVAWTVFQGNQPEAVPVEIIGVWKNAWGPKQDIIVAKMTGKASRTNVAGGMSGSPVYIDGKLVGAISLRLSVFSPDSICGITPIKLMTEINEFDTGKTTDSRTPDKLGKAQAQMSLPMPNDLLEKVVAAGSASHGAGIARNVPMMTPIATPVTMSGFSDSAVREFSPVFEQLGLVAVQGGDSAASPSAKPVKGWENSLQPGDGVAAVLVSGDMSMTAGGTVTYNDGKQVLAFGHPMFNLGQVDMPLAKEDIIMTLASSYQPTKMGNASDVVGALRQDRHSGIEGRLGMEAQMIPVTLHVRALNPDDSVRKTRDYKFSVFVDQKWTPYLMMATMFSSISNLNDFSEEATYRLSGSLKVAGQEPIQIATMQAPAEANVPTPMLLAGWWADKFNRLLINPASKPKVEAVDATVDLIPERRVAQIESAWIADNKVTAGTDVTVKVFLRQFHGERLEREVKVNIPAGLPRGEHRILFSDAETLDRVQTIAGSLNSFVDMRQTVSMLNQERSNSTLFVSLVESQPTVYSDEKVMPSVPASVLNVMQSGRSANHQFVSAPESIVEQTAMPFSFVVNGSYLLKINVN